LDKLGTVFNSTTTPLKYTPRRFVPSPFSQHVVIIESDHQVHSAVVRAQAAAQMAEEKKSSAGADEVAMEIDASAE